MIRAFIGVEIDLGAIQKISEAVAELKTRIPGIRWVSPTNFHFTLKFLGAIDESKVAPITKVMEHRLHPFSRFSINAKGLGVFPGVKQPRILWVGLEGARLAALVSAVDTALEPLGIAPEKRVFKPHLTVGRWRQVDLSPTNLGEQLAKWKDHEFGSSKVEEVVFFQSVLKPEGAVYSPLKVVALGTDERTE